MQFQTSPGDSLHPSSPAGETGLTPRSRHGSAVVRRYHYLLGGLAGSSNDATLETQSMNPANAPASWKKDQLVLGQPLTDGCAIR